MGEEQRDYSIENISAFIKYINDSKHDYAYFKELESKTFDQTNDLLHSLELKPHSAIEMSKIAKKLKEVRQVRRRAKNAIEVLHPLIEWSEKNSGAIKFLEQTLGEMRKRDKNAENRAYFPRTTIYEEIGIKE